MVYADTDFFLALLKPSDWLKGRAARILEQYRGTIWTSPATLIELLLVARRYGLDPEGVLVATIKIAELRGGAPGEHLLAAHYVKERGIDVLDAVHAAFCGRREQIISSDKVFDRLGLERVRLEAA